MSDLWQPIASAPMDNTEIMAWGAKLGRRIVEYEPAHSDLCRWIAPEGYTFRADAFTHWMPLPEPPGVNRRTTVRTKPTKSGA